MNVCLNDEPLLFQICKVLGSILTPFSDVGAKERDSWMSAWGDEELCESILPEVEKV